MPRGGMRLMPNKPDEQKKHPGGRKKGTKDKGVRAPRVMVLSAGGAAREQIATYVRNHGAQWFDDLVRRAQEAGDIRLEAQLYQFAFTRVYGNEPIGEPPPDAAQLYREAMDKLNAPNAEILEEGKDEL